MFLYLLFRVILFVVLALLSRFQMVARRLVASLRCQPQEEVHDIPEETIAPQVF